MEKLLEVFAQEIETERKLLRNIPVHTIAFKVLYERIKEREAIYKVAKEIEAQEEKTAKLTRPCSCFSKALEKVSESIPEDYWISEVNIPMKILRPGVLQIGTFKSALSQKKMGITLKIKYCPFCGSSVNNQN